MKPNVKEWIDRLGSIASLVLTLIGGWTVLRWVYGPPQEMYILEQTALSPMFVLLLITFGATLMGWCSICVVWFKPYDPVRGPAHLAMTIGVIASVLAVVLIGIDVFVVGI